MYLRRTTQKRADGSKLAHLQIAENVWDPVKKRSRVRILYSCGRADDEKAVERLRRLAKSILKRCSPEELVGADGAMRVVDTWPYGDVYVLEHLWRRSGLPELIEEFAGDHKFGFSVERALFAMVAHRALAPASKLHCWERWLAEEVRIEGCEALELQHLYRTMDFLVEHGEALEKGLYYRMADLFNLDVELIFYDTTSVHFEMDDEDTAAEGVARRRGHSKNGRGDAPQVVVGLAVTREGFPVRHWVFSGNTVDVSTVARVKRELGGWNLNRCVFVGDAGMVSKENLGVLARAGGRYIVCMPVHPGGKIDTEVLSRRGRYREAGPNLRVKEVVVGDGERRERYAVCHNPREAEQKRRHRVLLHRAGLLFRLQLEHRMWLWHLRSPQALTHDNPAGAGPSILSTFPEIRVATLPENQVATLPENQVATLRETRVATFGETAVATFVRFCRRTVMSPTPALVRRPTSACSHSVAPSAVWALPARQRTPRQSPVSLTNATSGWWERRPRFFGL